jgi:hypothetical protein
MVTPIPDISGSGIKSVGAGPSHLTGQLGKVVVMAEDIVNTVEGYGL